MAEPVTINEERLFQEFIKLAEISSPSLQERELAEYLKSRLHDFGFTIEEDETAAEIGGNTGNIFARLSGDGKYPALFFCCHMDTVVPADEIEVLFEDGIFRSKGDTVLGGDDKAGIAALLEVLEMIREQDQPHGTLEILLTVGEERGLLGSKNFDCSRLTANFGYILDSSGSPGAIITAAPAQNILTITVKGKSAHAGFEPELGVNAIRIASEVISRLPLGRIDEETTANIGIIEGGKATNIIPDAVFIQGETRSHKREKLDDITNKIVKEFEQIKLIPGADCDIRVTLEYPEYKIDPEQPVIKFASMAMERAGLKARMETTGGGSDANIFNSVGLKAANLAVGMQNAHTTEECLDSKDLVNVVRILWEMIQMSAAEVMKS